MSDAAEAVRAVEAIADLPSRMAAVLRDLPDTERRGVRFAAYQAAGIHLTDFASDEVNSADLQALTTEIMRRLRDNN